MASPPYDDDDYTDEDGDGVDGGEEFDGDSFDGDDDDGGEEGRYPEDDDEEDELEAEDEDGLVEEAMDDDDGIDDGGSGGDEIVGVPSSAARAAPPPAAPVPPREWTGLAGMPDPTRDRIEAALDRLVDAGADGVAVLVVGPPGGGKSALTNALLNERVASLHPLAPELERPVLAARAADLGDGRTARVTLIDTPGLADGDGPSPDAARALGGALAGRPLDAVLYVDRLDGYRVDESDVELMRLYTANLGVDMWDRTLIVLTHARLSVAPGGGSYDDYAAERAESLRRAARAAGARGSAPLPALLADTTSRAPTNAAGEPLLMDGAPWVPTLWEAVVDTALESGGAGGGPPAPLRPDPVAARAAADPDRRRRWIAPLALAAQIAVVAFLRGRVLPADGAKGDRDGPYPREVAAARLAALREARGEGKAKKAGAAASARPSAGRQAARRRAPVLEESDSD